MCGCDEWTVLGLDRARERHTSQGEPENSWQAARVAMQRPSAKTGSFILGQRDGTVVVRVDSKIRDVCYYNMATKSGEAARRGFIRLNTCPTSVALFAVSPLCSRVALSFN